MSLYVILNLAVLAAPFLLSFDKKVAYYKRWVPYLAAILVVSTIYIVWDVLVTERGDWSFSKQYAGDPVLFGLPLGEVLFFISVPYACLFIYEVVRAYFAERTVRSARGTRIAAFAVSGVFVILALVFRNQDYTFLAMLSVAMMVTLAALVDLEMLRSSFTWLFFALSFIPFLIANGILTALPVVEYNADAIWGVRVYTIPLEDFFYNFGMLGAYLLVFRAAKRLFRRLRGRPSG